MIRIILLLCLLAAALGAGWLLRDRWDNSDAADIAADTTVVWEPITVEGAERARLAIASLGERSGRAFITLQPGDLASHIFLALSRKLPPSAEDVEAAVIGDRMHVRATVKTSDFGGAGSLGALGGFVGEREIMQFGGSFHVLRP